MSYQAEVGGFTQPIHQTLAEMREREAEAQADAQAHREAHARRVTETTTRLAERTERVSAAVYGCRDVLFNAVQSGKPMDTLTEALLVSIELALDEYLEATDA